MPDALGPDLAGPDLLRRPSLGRRHVLGGAALAGLALTLPALARGADLPPPLPGKPAPIGRTEREARLAKLRGLMGRAGIVALLVEPGASLVYFTGIEWWRSERPTVAVIPAEGEVAIVTPFFERPSVSQSLGLAAEIRVWQEDEDPFALVAGVLKDRKAGGALGGTVAIEETLRYFIVDGVKRALPSAEIVSGAGVVRACRLVKSPAEIALMQRATNITIAAYRHTIPRVAEGMMPKQVGDMMDAATIALGGSPEFSLVLMGEAAASPHGSSAPQMAREGNVVLMDCGCTVEGYQSDVSRSFVLGRPSDRQRRVWDQVHRGQQTAFAAARIGTPAGAVDDAVRRLYEGFGYGPGYTLPGLSHRTGHGIGLDGHEPVNLVHGETLPLAPGMCFSDEPGLYIPGAFGIRLEDCFHMSEAGPVWFSQPSESIERPV